MKRFLVPTIMACALVGGWLARPVRWRIEGLSMAPGLLPGDVAEGAACPQFDRWRRPRRFERWTLAGPDGTLAVKRVWGMPGEDIAIVDGDLVVDAAVVVKPPGVLAEVALPVPDAKRAAIDGAVRLTLPAPVFDDVPFAPDERRVLTTVRDIGVVARIRVDKRHPGEEAASVDVRVAGRTVRVRPPRAGRHVIVAGRLDHSFVATSWLLGDRPVATRSPLPPGAPATWAVCARWHEDEPVTSLEVRLVVDAASSARVTIEDVAAWRDIHHLVPATGTMRWQVGNDRHFVLGDFPGASRDSRQWGPVDAGWLRHRVTASPD